jgi:hypothetical protein
MEICIELENLITDEEEMEMLKEVLNCEDEEELSEKMVGIGEAAIYEYLEMILGKQFPTRANEIRERRLFHLLKHYFNGQIPTEADVASLFQLTERSSKTLLRNVRTKFKFELKQEIKNTIKDTLSSVKFKNDEYRVVIKNDNILEELKQTVSAEAPHLNQIKKVRNSAGTYKIPEDTLALLCEYYELDVESIEGITTTEE